MLVALIGILIICVIGAICFWAIDKFVRDGRLASLLKLLVVLICLAAILQRVLPLAAMGWRWPSRGATEARFGQRVAPGRITSGAFNCRGPSGDRRCPSAGACPVLAPPRR